MHYGAPFGKMSHQLALTIPLNDEAILSDFYWGENRVLEQEIQKALTGKGERFFYLWGNQGSGKSHLLQACCQIISLSSTSIYLPLETFKAWGPESIEGIGEQGCIAVDDIDKIAGQPGFEEALFHLYNRARESTQTLLLISGKCPPASLGLNLADLQSRLAWGLVAPLLDLDDELKIMSLQRRAKKRGFELPLSVAQFILSRCERNMHALQNVLNLLDEASLVAQRKITLPFVKEILQL